MQSPDDIRRWIAQRRAAETRQHAAERDVVPDPAEAIERSLRLIDLVAHVRGWPPPEDEYERAEDMAVYARWAKLRATLGGHE